MAIFCFQNVIQTQLNVLSIEEVGKNWSSDNLSLSWFLSCKKACFLLCKKAIQSQTLCGPWSAQELNLEQIAVVDGCYPLRILLFSAVHPIILLLQKTNYDTPVMDHQHFSLWKKTVFLHRSLSLLIRPWSAFAVAKVFWHHFLNENKWVWEVDMGCRLVKGVVG